MLATAATVMPQIGSIASAAALGAATPATATERVSAGGRRAAVTADGDDLRQDRERDLGGRARTDVETRGHVDASELLLGHAVAAQLGEHSRAALRAGDEADVGQARLEAAAQRVQLVAPVGGDDERKIAGPRRRRRRPARSTASSPSCAPISRTASAVGVAPTTSTRGAGSTGSRNTSITPPDKHGFWTTTAPSSAVKSIARAALAVLGERQDPQQHRLAALQRLQRIGAHAVLGADAADEALDRAVGEHERDISRLHARRPLHVHHRRGHERRAFGTELLGPPRESRRDHCGGSGRPCIAAQTRAGVHGMSTCSTPCVS